MNWEKLEQSPLRKMLQESDVGSDGHWKNVSKTVRKDTDYLDIVVGFWFLIF